MDGAETGKAWSSVAPPIGRRARRSDIEGILETCRHLDFDWIRTRLAEFDRALGRTGLLDEFERTVARTRRQAPFGDPAE